MIEESNLNLHLMGKQVFCFIAEVMWHLTMNLFPAKISERAINCKIYDVRITAKCKCYPPVLTDNHIQKGLMNFQLQNPQLQLYVTNHS